MGTWIGAQTKRREGIVRGISEGKNEREAE